MPLIPWRRPCSWGASSGGLAIIGGAEDRSGSSPILRQVIARCRVGAPFVVVVDAASRRPSRFAALYQAAFMDLGASVVHTPRLDSRGDAEDARIVAMMEEADLVYFAGGDQSRLVGILRGTRAHQCLLRRHADDGVVIGGTSAGAAALSVRMIARGDSTLWPRRGQVRIADGLGFTELVVDQHFSQRGRLGRLMEALAIVSDGDAYGVGVDEDTALILLADGSGEVVGSGGVALLRLARGDGAAWRDTLPQGIISIPKAEIAILCQGDRVWNVEHRPAAARGEA